MTALHSNRLYLRLCTVLYCTALHECNDKDKDSTTDDHLVCELKPQGSEVLAADKLKGFYITSVLTVPNRLILWCSFFERGKKRVVRRGTTVQHSRQFDSLAIDWTMTSGGST